MEHNRKVEVMNEEWKTSNAEPKEGDARSWAETRKLVGGKGYQVSGGSEPDGIEAGRHREETYKKII